MNSEITAREVIVYGNASGNLRARDRVEIKKDGQVIGDITTTRISIEEGAYFKGQSKSSAPLADSRNQGKRKYSGRHRGLLNRCPHGTAESREIRKSSLFAVNCACPSIRPL